VGSADPGRVPGNPASPEPGRSGAGRSGPGRSGPAPARRGSAQAVPSVPNWLSGAWWRTRLVVDGRVVRRPGPALWVQDGERFVDLRGPGSGALDGPRVMAGTVSWDPPLLWWHHAVDSAPEERDDIGRILRRGDRVLVETGLVGSAHGPVPYRERWERLDGPIRPSVRRDRRGFVVRTATPLPLELRIEAPPTPTAGESVSDPPAEKPRPPRAPVPSTPVPSTPVPSTPVPEEEP
jgi:hypothetical protein